MQWESRCTLSNATYKTKKSKTLISCTHANTGVFTLEVLQKLCFYCPNNLCAWMMDHVPTYMRAKPRSKKTKLCRCYQKSVKNACAFRCFLGFKINIYGRYFKVFLENYLSSVKSVTGGAEPIYRQLVVNFISFNRTGCRKYQQGAGRCFQFLVYRRQFVSLWSRKLRGR